MSILLHGKEYIEVKDRVAEAHTEDGFSMLSEETFSMGGREYVRVYIEVKGKQYIGTAECKFNANPKTPDGTSPYECGETSALGRALGFAGYGAVDSIASADEVVRNEHPTPQTKKPLIVNQDWKPVQVTTLLEAPNPWDLQKWFKDINQTIQVAQSRTFPGQPVKNLDDLSQEECLALKKTYDGWKATYDARAKAS